MKKVLFVLGLAMCSTLAMAQTNKAVGKLCNPTQGTEKLVIDASRPVDYKASIFTKDEGDVELGYFNFANLSDVTIGVIQASDVIDGVAVGAVRAHNRTEPCFRWARIPDTNYVMDSAFQEDFANFLYYIGEDNLLIGMGAYNGLTDNNGFMFISLTEMDQDNNAINTYFSLSPVPLQGAEVVDVTFRQLYRKYYDSCFIDYKLNGSWHSFEVNVTGIDCDVTDYSSIYYVATMPTAALNQTNLELRFRISADGTLPYGYGWAVDDVKVIAPAATTRWSFNSDGTIHGFYGTLPQGMTIPMSYAVFSRNIGKDALSGIELSVLHRSEGVEEWSEAFSVPQTGLTMPAGDPVHDYLLEINECGAMYAGHGCRDYVGYHSFPENWDQYMVTDAQLAAAGYQRRGLPTANIGMNQFLITASNAQDLNDTLAAYTYTVSDILDVDDEFGRTVPGYRWGNDNGIVAGGVEFGYGFTSGSPSDAGYVTSDCEHQYEQGYEVLTRYNTPSVIPTDEAGQPWVIRGMEFVTSTKVVANQAAGARYSIEMYRYEMRAGDDTGWYGYMGHTGLTGGEIYLVGENNVAPDADALIGYATAENGNYYATNVFFPEQPALEPNVSFLLGYTNEGGGDFAVARQAYSYKSGAGENEYTSYRQDEYLAPYYRQFTPINKPYDVYCYDPIQGSRGNGTHVVTGWNIELYPLIRLIVGPKMVVPEHYVSANCTEDENENYNYWVYSYSTRDGICGVNDTVLEGAIYSYLVFPGDPAEEQNYEQDDDDNTYYVTSDDADVMPSKVIDNIYVNGEALDLTDSNVVMAYDYTVYWAGHTPLEDEDNQWEPALERKCYRIMLRNITDDVVITASVHSEQLGIRNVEDNVNLVLAPNPATSQVRVNVGGFTGKADCSIIDMSGRVVYNAAINAGETVINLNNIPAGAYFVRVTNDSFSKVEKLIVR